ncbi:MAG: hypothetical protein IJE09_04485 [Oscillospiraceae bacterium]|nr:hypothetical protein [Oscillospiraceae bacterium]
MIVKQKELFTKWKKDRESFVSDGLVDEAEYLNAPRKLLFLLKEVNGGESWDLCEFLRKGGRAQTWNNVARWVEGIFNLEREIPWTELDADKKSNEQRRLDMLKKICAVNVKKSPGGHTSVNDEICDAGKRDAEYLREQLAIYEPEIIICCGTDWVYSKELAINELQWQRTSRGIWYTYDGNRLVIAYLHPEARVQSSLIYYGLIDAVKEILAY